MNVLGYAQQPFSPSMAPIGSQIGSSSTECKLHDYNISDYARAFLEAQVNATIPIIGESGNFTGNGFAISKNLLLTCKHCLSGNQTHVVNGMEALTVFDGSPLDFAVIYVKEANFSPLVLDIAPNASESLQLYFKLDGENKLDTYVREFQADNSPYASRADFGSTNTNFGESGAARMSLQTGAVHAIHQGQAEGLMMRDIFTAVLDAMSNDQHAYSTQARRILEAVTVKNLEMLPMYQSTVILQQGDVTPEKKRIHKKITLTHPVINSRTNREEPKEFTFQYVEVGEGRDKRKISIFLLGVPNTEKKLYAIDLDPHTIGQYDASSSACIKFYEALATAIATSYLNNRLSYPQVVQANALRKDITLTMES